MADDRTNQAAQPAITGASAAASGSSPGDAFEQTTIQNLNVPAADGDKPPALEVVKRHRLAVAADHLGEILVAVASHFVGSIRA